MTDLLNLSDADLSGFEAIPAGRYNAEVFKIETDAVKNTDGTGKMPAGTPMLKIQFRLTEDPYANRRVFVTYVIPPKDYDKEKAQKMKGMIARFFIALGDSEETVKNPKFNPDFEDYIGRECVVQVGHEPKRDRSGAIIEGEWNNPVKGIKAAGTLAGAGSSSGLL